MVMSAARRCSAIRCPQVDESGEQGRSEWREGTASEQAPRRENSSLLAQVVVGGPTSLVGTECNPDGCSDECAVSRCQAGVDRVQALGQLLLRQRQRRRESDQVPAEQ